MKNWHHLEPLQWHKTWVNDHELAFKYHYRHQLQNSSMFSTLQPQIIALLSKWKPNLPQNRGGWLHERLMSHELGTSLKFPHSNSDSEAWKPPTSVQNLWLLANNIMIFYQAQSSPKYIFCLMPFHNHPLRNLLTCDECRRKLFEGWPHWWGMNIVVGLFGLEPPNQWIFRPFLFILFLSFIFV